MAWNALGNWLSRLNPLNWEREFTEYFAADDADADEGLGGELLQAQSIGPMFRKLALDCRHFGGYDCCGPALWMLRETAAEVVVVESDAERLQQFAHCLETPEFNEMAGRARLVSSDLRGFGSWRELMTPEDRQQVGDYLAAPWKFRLGQPDLLLINGRFRVACFLYALLQAEPGTRLLVRGYRQQDKYHVAEEFCPVAEACGDDVLFLVPEEIDRRRAEEALVSYSAAMD
ncbi:MAG: hypothetical protein ACK49R_17420 [Planctomycetota bacterium]